MSTYNIRVNCKKVEVEYSHDRKLVDVYLEEVELDDIITEIGSTNVLDHFSHEDIAHYVAENDVPILGMED